MGSTASISVAVDQGITQSQSKVLSFAISESLSMSTKASSKKYMTSDNFDEVEPSPLFSNNTSKSTLSLQIPNPTISPTLQSTAKSILSNDPFLKEFGVTSIDEYDGSFDSRASANSYNSSYLKIQRPKFISKQSSTHNLNMEQIKDKLYPKSLKSVKSLRSLALLNHAKQENHYIPMQEMSHVGGSLVPRDDVNSNSVYILQNSTLNNVASNNHNSSNASNTSQQSNISSTAGMKQKMLTVKTAQKATGSNNNSSGNLSIPKNGSGNRLTTSGVNSNSNNSLTNAINVANNNGLVMNPKKKPNLRINIQDDHDWIQVSDDEGGDDHEDTETPWRRQMLAANMQQQSQYLQEQQQDSPQTDKLNANQPQLQLQLQLQNNNNSNLNYNKQGNHYQSYLFTQSGTIFVDGFKEGIRKDGIVSSNLPTILSPTHASSNSESEKAKERSNNNLLEEGHDSVIGNELQGSSNKAPITVPMKERLVILCRLGQGASSVVYKALDLLFMRIVAVKMIPMFDRGRRRQMVRELSTLFGLLHRNKSLASIDSAIKNDKNDKNPKDFIVDFFDAFSNVDEGGVGLMIEYMDGGSLQDIVDSGGCDDEATLSNIAKQALQGLKFLHSCSQLHRDLKPSNFLISHTGDVKIADLGILKQLDNSTVIGSQPEFSHPPPPLHEDLFRVPSASNDDNHNGPSNVDAEVGFGSSENPMTTPIISYDLTPSLPRTHTFIGTATYMSPERLDGKEYSFPADIWAFGLSLMTISMGKLPFETTGGYWTIIQYIRDEALVPKLSDKFSSVFKDFLSCCLERIPAKRFTCEQLLQHPFITNHIDDDSTEIFQDDDRGIFELEAILQAVLQHLDRILDNPNHSTNTTVSAFPISPIFGDISQLMAETPGHGIHLRLKVVKELLGRLFLRPERLDSLAKQLYLPTERLVLVTKEFIDGICIDENSGSITPGPNNASPAASKPTATIGNRFTAKSI